MAILKQVRLWGALESCPPGFYGTERSLSGPFKFVFPDDQSPSPTINSETP